MSKAYDLYGYRYERKKQRIKTQDYSFGFSCSQSLDREHAEKAAKAGGKARVTRRMERFACGGWLCIYVKADSLDVTVKIKHDCAHKPYVDIELPAQWKTYIEEHARVQLPSQVGYE